MVKVKGNEIEVPVFRDSFDRRAVQIENRIMATLKMLNIDRDNVHLKMERNARLKVKAKVSWYFEGRNLSYSYGLCSKFIENLYVVDKVLETEVDRLLDEEITLDEFHREFVSDDKGDEKLIEARRTLGVAEDCEDFEEISRHYKVLAKKFHPDMEGGDHEMFQKINAAHKLIRKELE
ncbi:J domain-containing protein [Candidatus Pacearchaeota archaeon]|nr:J domain-containing protein [Candidatus Pacearchaeota archaeon]